MDATLTARWTAQGEHGEALDDGAGSDQAPSHRG